MNARERLDALTREHPEWSAWLSVLRELVPELTDSRWDNTPPHTQAPTTHTPWLASATLRPDGVLLGQLLARLGALAFAQGLHDLVGKGLTDTTGQALPVFLASINADDLALDPLATQTGATPEGFRALAALLPMPYLHACARHWSAVGRTGWSEGYCPVCGAWPAFAEVRGIDRARHLRCGRCAASWAMPVLACTYCGTTDHEQLGTLVVDDRTSTFAVDVCRTCSGYLKSCTTLQATPADSVLAVDLASVAFDLAAVERGFRRPPGNGFSLKASCVAQTVPPPVVDPPASPAPRRWWSRT
jgi:FdhE protein